MENAILKATDVRFLERITTLRSNGDQALQRLSGGKNIAKLSDSPSDLVTLGQLTSQTSYAEQLGRTLGRFKAETDAGDQALQNAVLTLQDSVTAGVKGANSTSTAATRNTLADQIDGALQHLVRLSNTQVEGRYIFSGDSDQTAAYTYDATQANPISAYGGTAATRQVEHPLGGTFAVSLTAADIFADSTNNAFGSLVALRDALRANDTTAITNAVDSLKGAQSFVGSQLSRYGGFQSNVKDAIAASDKQKTALAKSLGDLQDPDTVAEATRLSSSNQQLEAALTARSKISSRSLFDFLA